MANLIFNDTFTDTNGTALTAHTPDTGTGWTEEERTGTAIQQIDSNAASPSANEASVRHIYSAQPDPGTPDYDVEFTIVAMSGADDPFFLVARFADANNYYSAGAYNDGTFKIFKKVSGTVTELDSFSGSFANGDTFKFELRGTALKLYKNGSEQCSATDSDLTSAGKAGFGAGNAWAANDDVGSAASVDDFSVTENAINEKGKTITVTGAVSETNSATWNETAKALTAVAVVSETDFKVQFETGLSLTAVASITGSHTYVHIETGSSITIVGGLSEDNVMTMDETGKSFTMVGVLNSYLGAFVPTPKGGAAGSFIEQTPNSSGGFTRA